jgi:hypothetical protein
LGVEPLITYGVGEPFRGMVSDALDWDTPERG